MEEVSVREESSRRAAAIQMHGRKESAELSDISSATLPFELRDLLNVIVAENDKRKTCSILLAFALRTSDGRGRKCAMRFLNVIAKNHKRIRTSYDSKTSESVWRPRTEVCYEQWQCGCIGSLRKC